jgi:hypothetical protein
VLQSQSLFLNSTDIMSRPTKKLVVLCDGTWCGRETGTETNISLIAQAIGIKDSPAVTTTKPLYLNPERPNLKACYFPGAGLGGTFLEYLFNGATANDIGKECMEVYEYIVKNFDDNTEIWMFGLSRGSYTVRCVAGMINNCGIVKKRSTDDETSLLIQEVYATYRSPFDEDKPDAKEMVEFRKKASWQVKSPINVMAIIDTVGSLGIPRLESGVGFTWPEFHDQNISSKVQKVYHACSIHDRLWVFQPCRARRTEDFEAKYKHNKEYFIDERYFPGCHYDLGRQKFKFFRDGVNIIEKFFFAIPNHLTNPVIPNAVCADFVLQWFYQAIQENDPKDQVLEHGAKANLAKLQEQMAGYQNPGSGDVYSDMQKYSPAGFIGTAIWNFTSAAASIANKLTPSAQLGTAIQSFLGVRTILNILLATRDRRIQNRDAKVLDLDDPMTALGGQSPYAKGLLDRYKTTTLKRLQLVRQIVEGEKYSH